MYGPLKYLPWIVAALIVLAASLVVVLNEYDPGTSIPTDKDGAGAVAVDPAAQPGVLTPGKGKPMAGLVGSWPGFAGPARDYKADTQAKLATVWPAGGPPILWHRTVCNGHAGVAILDGRVYLGDYDPTLFPGQGTKHEGADPAAPVPPAGGDVIRCMSLADGQDIWTYHYGPVTTKNNHGITRPIPAVDGKFLVGYGPKMQVHCLDSTTGAFRWAMSMETQYGAKEPGWYAGQCPLLEPDGTVILAPSGPKVLMLKVRCEDGQVLWTAENTLGSDQTHTSIMRMTLSDGQKCYLYSGTKGVAGINPASGETLFETKEWNAATLCGSPVPLPGDHVFLVSGYGKGSMLLRIEKNPDASADQPYLAVPVFKLKEQEFGSINHTPIVHDGAIWGIRPSGEFVCMQPVGAEMQFLWSSTRAVKYGDGPYLMAPQQGLIYALEEHGRLDLIAVDKAKFNRLAQTQLWEAEGGGKDAWGPMALAGDRLILRDLKRLVCLDVGAK